MFLSGVFFIFINMPYKITDAHTCADVGLIVSGNDLTQLFSDAADGLMKIMVEPDGLEERRNLIFEIEEDNLEDLFYCWLSELIYYKDAKDFLLKGCQLEITGNEKFKLKAVLSGDNIDPKRHILKIDVKAVTYYRFRIEKIDDIWHGEVVFDL